MSLMTQQPALPGMDSIARREAISPMQLLQIAIEREGSIDVIERLAKLQMEMLDREARLAYGESYEEFKRNAPRIVRDKSITIEKDGKSYIRGKFADLDQCCDKLIPALLSVGITHRWQTHMSEDGKTIFVTCYLRHRLGHEEVGSTLGAGPDTSGGKNAIQAAGSTVSYLERYTLVASCGISIRNQDTDGNPSQQQTKPEDLLDESVVLDFIESIQGSATTDELKANYQAAVKAGEKDPSALSAFDKAKRETWKKRGFRA